MQDNYEHTDTDLSACCSRPGRTVWSKPGVSPMGNFGDFRLLLEGCLDTGFARECHGDLHLANVCLWNEKGDSVRLHRIQ